MGKHIKHNSSISILPDHVIDNILARLPLRFAAATSILSKDWRNKWTYIPDLMFDFRFDRTIMPNHKLEPIIDQVLLNHRGPINKFALQVPSCEGSPPDIDNWILVLSNYKVRDFTLHFCWGYKHQMPSHFFAFQHLKHLNLYKCVFNPPPGFKGFGRLVILDCQNVDFEPSIFGRFISQCMLLERVRLVECTEWDSFEIEGPSLRFFTFHGVFKCIRFKNCPVLAEVSLSLPTHIFTRYETDHCIKYFDFLPTLEKLHLHPPLLEILGAGGVSNQFPRRLNNLKVLDLSMLLEKIEEVACALCFIKSSPNLQMLKITFFIREVMEAVSEFIRAQEMPNHYLKHVRKVEIPIFCGVEPQMEFVRYLLASATQLEEMVITPANSALRSSLMIQLEQLPRASPSALIILTKK